MPIKLFCHIQFQFKFLTLFSCLYGQQPGQFSYFCSWLSVGRTGFDSQRTEGFRTLATASVPTVGTTSPLTKRMERVIFPWSLSGRDVRLTTHLPPSPVDLHPPPPPICNLRVMINYEQPYCYRHLGIWWPERVDATPINLNVQDMT
jgi:hypothetical protein